jgi:hypothetical protein
MQITEGSGTTLDLAIERIRSILFVRATDGCDRVHNLAPICARAHVERRRDNYVNYCIFIIFKLRYVFILLGLGF